ncbi:MAG: PLP-dependent aminotransferase family protein [Thermoleophilia bacterium]
MKVTPERVVRLLGAWASGSGPLYERLARALTGAIERRELAPGAVLPTERELAAALAVSRTTVVGAYASLKAAGRLESRQGSGTWVAARDAAPVPERAFSGELYATLLGPADEDLIELTAACPPTTSLVREVVAEMSPHEMASVVEGSGYHPAGLPELRVRIAELVTAEGLLTAPDQIVVTSGAQQAIQLVTMLFGEPGQTVLMEELTYPGALDIARGAGLRPVGARMDADGVDPDAVEDLLERVRPRFIYLVATFHNPTGSALAERRGARIADLAARYRVPVVEDRALRRLELDERPVPPPIASHGDGEDVLVIGSLSKVLWAGLRVGWIRAARPLVERLMRMKILTDMGSAVPSQHIATRLVPRLDEAVAERREFLRLRQATLGDALARHLPDWEWEAPRGGCNLWVSLPDANARDFAQVAQRQGVSVVPGQVLSAEGGHAGWLRLPFVHEPEVIEEAVRRMARAWSIYSEGGSRAAREPSLIV